jgi:hypothetical protein
MASSEEKYRRLPGRRRGLGTSASLWLGSDHILLVKSAWFREEYKRFYLRDIQAIVVAPGARFYVSLPMLIGALVWLLPGFGMAFWRPAEATGWGLATVAMAGTWLAISIAASCRCRLYTAVSKDDLPSLYRTWTARRFLRQVQPRIEEVQGVAAAGWVEAERGDAGPAAARALPVATPPRAAARSHTLASDLFVLGLFVASLVGMTTADSVDTAWFRANSFLALLQLAGAIATLIQSYRGGLGRAMRRIAIASLVLTGVLFYAQTFAFTFVNAARLSEVYRAFAAIPRSLVVVRQAAHGVGLLLAFAGGVIILRSTYEDEADIIKD